MKILDVLVNGKSTHINLDAIAYVEFSEMQEGGEHRADLHFGGENKLTLWGENAIRLIRETTRLK
jgi:hypothetical protein